MRKILLFSTVVSLFVIGCAPRYPTTAVSTIDSRPTLSFINAPAGSVALVDGINMGDATKFNGKPKVLAVEPGTHEVTVMQGSVVVSKQTVFVESEQKVINVH